MSDRITLQVKKRPVREVVRDVPSIEDSIRLRASEILTEKLSHYFTDSELTSLEYHIHTAAIQNMSKLSVTDHKRLQRSYDLILKNMCLNLDPDSYIKNTYLLPEIKAGRLSIEELPYMCCTSLNPVIWNKQLQTRQAETHLVTEGANVATTTLIKCGKCGSGVKYTEEQTRSADEAMTIKAECLKCGNRFNI